MWATLVNLDHKSVQRRMSTSRWFLSLILCKGNLRKPSCNSKQVQTGSHTLIVPWLCHCPHVSFPFFSVCLVRIHVQVPTTRALIFITTSQQEAQPLPRRGGVCVHQYHLPISLTLKDPDTGDWRAATVTVMEQRVPSAHLSLLCFHENRWHSSQSHGHAPESNGWLWCQVPPCTIWGRFLQLCDKTPELGGGGRRAGMKVSAGHVPLKTA